MSNRLQKYEWMLRIPICNLQTGMELLKRIPDPQPSEYSNLPDAIDAMHAAIWHMRQWAEWNDVVIRESMHT